MGANGLVCMLFIIAVVIKNGITKPSIELQSGFKPFFPKISISSKTPPSLLNSILSDNNTLERTNDLQNETLNYSASKLLNNVTKLPLSSHPIDQQLLSTRHGSVGYLPDFTSFRPPFFINPFGRRPFYLPFFHQALFGPPLRHMPAFVHPFARIFNGIHPYRVVPPVPNVNPNYLRPDSPSSNVANQSPVITAYGVVVKQPLSDPKSVQQKPVYLPLPQNLKPKYDPRHDVPNLQKSKDNHRYPVYPIPISPEKPGLGYALQSHRYQALMYGIPVHKYGPHNAKQGTPSELDIVRSSTDSRTQTYRHSFSQNRTDRLASITNFSVPSLKAPAYTIQNVSYPSINSVANAEFAQKVKASSIKPDYPQIDNQSIIYRHPTVKKLSVNSMGYYPAVRQQVSYSIPRNPMAPLSQTESYATQNARYGISNPKSQFGIAQQLLSLSRRHPFYMTPSQAADKPSVHPKFYASVAQSLSPNTPYSATSDKVPKTVYKQFIYASMLENNSTLGGISNSDTSHRTKYTEYAKHVPSSSSNSATGTVSKTDSASVAPELARDTPKQHIYMPMIYSSPESATSYYSNQNPTKYGPALVQENVLGVSQPLAHSNSLNVPNNLQKFQYAFQQPSYSAYAPKISNHSLKKNAPTSSFAKSKNMDAAPVPGFQQVPFAYNAQGQSTPNDYSRGPQTTNPAPFPSSFPLNNVPVALQVPQHMSQHPARQYGLPLKYNNNAPLSSAYFAHGTHYIPKQYMYLAPNNLAAQNHESYFPYSPQTYPHAPKEERLANEMSAKLLWGTHSFNHALLKLKAPETHPFGGHMPTSDSHNEQFSDCGHSWLSYMKAPPEMSAASKNAMAPSEISHSVSENNAILTSNPTKSTVSKDIDTVSVPNDPTVSSSMNIVANRDNRNHLPNAYSPDKWSFGHPHHFPSGPYYLAPYIVTNIRVQSPENSDQRFAQPSPHYISQESAHFSQAKKDSAGKKFEAEMEEADSKATEPGFSNQSVISNIRVATVKVFNEADVDSKNQSLETSTVAFSQLSTSQIPKVTEVISSESLTFLESKRDIIDDQMYTTLSSSTPAENVLSKSSDHHKLSDSMKKLTHFPFQRNSPISRFTYLKRSTPTSLIATTARSQNKITGESAVGHHHQL